MQESQEGESFHGGDKGRFVSDVYEDDELVRMQHPEARARERPIVMVAAAPPGWTARRQIITEEPEGTEVNVALASDDDGGVVPRRRRGDGLLGSDMRRGFSGHRSGRLRMWSDGDSLNEVAVRYKTSRTEAGSEEGGTGTADSAGAGVASEADNLAATNADPGIPSPGPATAEDSPASLHQKSGGSAGGKSQSKLPVASAHRAGDSKAEGQDDEQEGAFDVDSSDLDAENSLMQREDEQYSLEHAGDAARNERREQLKVLQESAQVEEDASPGPAALLEVAEERRHKRR